MRVCIYARSATGDKQDIDNQIQQCQIKAQKLNATDISYRIDSGYSGITNERPGLTELLQDAAAGNIHIVVAAEPARISRNLKDLNEILDKLKPVKVFFANDIIL